MDEPVPTIQDRLVAEAKFQLPLIGTESDEILDQEANGILIEYVNDYLSANAPFEPGEEAECIKEALTIIADPEHREHQAGLAWIMAEVLDG